jgi:NAD(P)-dependent dehydrogenase (short-subunit alcohol dehydrogenase family)
VAARLEGKGTLVTGGASGIGRATALACAREGTKLIIADLQGEGGHHTVHLITAKGGEASVVQTDVTHATEVEALISKAVARYGRPRPPRRTPAWSRWLPAAAKRQRSAPHQCMDGWCCRMACPLSAVHTHASLSRE